MEIQSTLITCTYADAWRHIMNIMSTTKCMVDVDAHIRGISGDRGLARPRASGGYGGYRPERWPGGAKFTSLILLPNHKGRFYV